MTTSNQAIKTTREIMADLKEAAAAAVLELELQEWEIEWAVPLADLTPMLAERGLKWDGEKIVEIND